MYIIALDEYQSAALGAVILVLGTYLLSRFETLKKFCIPAAVVGGLVFSLINTCLYYSGTLEFTMGGPSGSLFIRDVFMYAFFCSVGFLASFRMLKVGGKLVILLLFLVSLLLIIQDALGASLAAVFGLDPKLGLCLGSISLTGGHATATTWGNLLETDYGISGAFTVATAAATFGLAVSGLIGGPLAKRRVQKHNLVPDGMDVEMNEEENKVELVENNRFMNALILLVISVGLGTYIVSALKSVGVAVPGYIGAMIIALIIRNIADLKHKELPMREITLLGTICLALFLSMAMMTMKLWQIADLAIPMIATLLIQTAIVALFAYFIIFRFTGSNYDSAAYTTAVCGFGLGATPNAVANMDSLFSKYGAAPSAYFVVPLVGSVFLDLVNTGVLTIFLNML